VPDMRWGRAVEGGIVEKVSCFLSVVCVVMFPLPLIPTTPRTCVLLEIFMMISSCIGFVWQCFSSGGAAEVVSVRSC